MACGGGTAKGGKGKKAAKAKKGSTKARRGGRR